MGTKQTLVIVESPSKARTLRKVLGKEYLIEASVGQEQWCGVLVAPFGDGKSETVRLHQAAAVRATGARKHGRGPLFVGPAVLIDCKACGHGPSI